MAIYKIFPEKTATIYSYTPTKNTGIDEILEVSIYDNSSVLSRGDVSRALIKFSTSEINDIIQNKVAGANYSASLKVYLADASSLPTEYTLYCYPISGTWDRGTGRATNLPITTNGVSWIYRKNANEVTAWNTSSYIAGTTASYSTQGGGGVWYTNYTSTQSFTYNDVKDINIDVTKAISSSYNGTISNEGFIIKHNSLEFTTGSTIELKYFSGNTNTIYPPCLEIKWNDYSYSTGSLSTVTSDKIVATIAQNKAEYQQDSVQRFRVNVRDRYPTRVFQTTSVYLNNKLLPTASYWQLKDLDNDETIIDFDTSFTKISADSTSNYFDVYMNGLQPERYYKIILKTTVNGSTLVLDDNYIFKVVK